MTTASISFQNIFTSPKDTLHLWAVAPIPWGSSPWDSLVCFLSLWFFSLWTFHGNGITQTCDPWSSFCLQADLPRREEYPSTLDPSGVAGTSSTAHVSRPRMLQWQERASGRGRGRVPGRKLSASWSCPPMLQGTSRGAQEAVALLLCPYFRQAFCDRRNVSPGTLCISFIDILSPG